MGDQPVAGPLPTHRTTQTRNKRTQTSVPRAGFEPTIPVFKGAKSVHTLDHAATVIGGLYNERPLKVICTLAHSTSNVHVNVFGSYTICFNQCSY
jgi:hypothetical protein